MMQQTEGPLENSKLRVFQSSLEDWGSLCTKLPLGFFTTGQGRVSALNFSLVLLVTGLPLTGFQRRLGQPPMPSHIDSSNGAFFMKSFMGGQSLMLRLHNFPTVPQCITIMRLFSSQNKTCIKHDALTLT